MSTFSEIENGVYRWDGTDADHGFPIIGYVVATGEGNLLIDPPGTSGSVDEVKKLGNPRAIVITGQWHVRGAGKWKDAFGVPIAAPDSAADELAAAKTSADQTLDEGDSYLGWTALRLTASEGERTYDELALWNAERRIVVIGDFIAATEGGALHFGPHLFAQIPTSKLRPLVDRLLELEPRLLLSGHIGPREDVKEILEGLKSL